MSFPNTVPITDLPAANFDEETQQTLITQYQNSEVFRELLKVYTDALQETEAVMQDLLNKRLLDVAVGDQLTIIGDIVGQQRFQILTGTDGYFGFTDLFWLGYVGFHDIDGGDWLPTDGSEYTDLTDDQYRRFIRAKIFKNQCKFSLPEMEILAQYVMDDPGAFGSEPLPLLTDICFTRELVGWELALLGTVFTSDTNKRLIPAPMGTRVTFCYYPSGLPFGFVDLGYTGFADIDGGSWGVPIPT